MAPQIDPHPNGTATATVAAAPAAAGGTSVQSTAHPPVKDATREIVETVVFVIVLVLLLKTFVAEAFVIPTGSMAETLLGYQKWVTCPQCKYQFPVNCSNEVDPQDGIRVELLACSCPNCRWREVWREPGRDKKISEPPGWGSGDRVLVSKFPFDNGWLEQPRRFNVVVFKYPVEPQKNQTPMNYIKRLVGLPGETIAVSDGDVYVGQIKYPKDGREQADRPEDWWKFPFMYLNDSLALSAWKAGQFEILQKPPEEMLAMRRIVFDNDHQPADLAGKVKPRWQIVDKHWSADNPATPKVFRTDGAGGATTDWLRYQHILVDRGTTEPIPAAIDTRPQLIRNVMGYNSGKSNGFERGGDNYWVGDLMLECTVQVDAPVGSLVFELSKGNERFQASFDLATGWCTLTRSGDAKPLAKLPNVLTAGKHTLRFADFDNRLTLWVDGKLPFGDGVNYPAVPAQPDNPNNLEPASVGAAGGAKLSVSNLQLWRDTYYTHNREHQVVDGIQTFFVQPGHYLCLGDNSSESSDSRFWGLVPERLLLGRALLVYFPFTRMGVIR